MSEPVEWFLMGQDGVITLLTEEEHQAGIKRYPLCTISGHPDYRNRREAVTEHLWTEEKLLDEVDRWHEMHGDGVPLHEFLGMTHDEYARWVENPSKLPPRRKP